LDIAELKSLQEKSERNRVQDILSIEARRLETKLVELLKRQEETLKTAPAPATTATPSAAATKAYDFAVKTYCKI